MVEEAGDELRRPIARLTALAAVPTAITHGRVPPFPWSSWNRDHRHNLGEEVPIQEVEKAKRVTLLVTLYYTRIGTILSN